MIKYLFSIILSLTLTSCALHPYWQDQQQNPQPTQTNLSPNSAPLPPIGWKEYTTVGQVNIRKEPNTSSPTVGWLLAGATIRADCHREDGFCEVTGGYVIAACLGVGEKKCQAK